MTTDMNELLRRLAGLAGLESAPEVPEPDAPPDVTALLRREVQRRTGRPVKDR